MIWAIVPAAGRGARLPGEVPKQYRRLAGRTVLDHCLDRLLADSRIAGVMLALASDDPLFTESAHAQDGRVRTCVGGAERADSVLAALRALDTSKLLADNDGVLVHDAARALLPAEALDRLLAQPPGPEGAILACPVQDTLKRAGADGHVAQTLDREGIWQAQTPQYFQFGALRKALSEALAAGERITDEASCMEWAGLHPRLVLGDALNFKITTAADLRIAAALLESSCV